MDEGVHWGIQNGLQLSRSTIKYFKHNDMESLRNTLEKVTQENKRAKKLRRYIVVEAVYQNSGQIAPLDEIIKLKEKYRFRVLLDESNSLGVLGSSGKGLTEYYNVPVDKIDIITAAMGHALATEGGFCTGSTRVIEHQVVDEVHGIIFSQHNPNELVQDFSLLISGEKLTRFAHTIGSSGRLLSKNMFAVECITGYAKLLENVITFPSNVPNPGDTSQLKKDVIIGARFKQC